MSLHVNISPKSHCVSTISGADCHQAYGSKTRKVWKGGQKRKEDWPSETRQEMSSDLLNWVSR